MCMRTEFQDAYMSLMDNAFFRLDRALRLKMHATNYCDKYMFRDNNKLHNDQIDPALNDTDSKKQVGFRRSFTHGIKKISVAKKFVFTPVDLREVDD